MTTPELLLDGLAFGESPRWHDGALWLADWGAGEVLRLDAGGGVSVVARLESFPLCIDFLPDGALLAVSSATGTLLRQDADGALVPHADLAAAGSPPWNEVVVDRRGRAYVNAIGFDFPGGEPAPGRVVLAEPGRPARVVAGDLQFPNGMVLTPDGATLLVAESYAHRITAFDVADDGGLTGRRVWADLADGTPDGICLDAEGALWYADVPAQRCVRVREGGAVLQEVQVDRGCFSCALGGPEGRTLHLVAMRWEGPAQRGAGARTGQVLALDVAVGAPTNRPRTTVEP